VTRYLDCDRDGILWLVQDESEADDSDLCRVRLGPIEDAGPPADLAWDHCELLDQWRSLFDARDLISELTADYFRSRGPC
jgi:hypothetical protein